MNHPAVCVQPGWVDEVNRQKDARLSSPAVNSSGALPADVRNELPYADRLTAALDWEQGTGG